jgi:RHS repeat-associated protein
MAMSWLADGVVPAVVKVSVPESIGSATDDNLSGDYYLRLRRRSAEYYTWEVALTDVPKWSRAILIVDEPGGSTRGRFQILDTDSGGGPVWELRDVGSLRSPESAELRGIASGVIFPEADLEFQTASADLPPAVSLVGLTSAQPGSGNPLLARFSDDLSATTTTTAMMSLGSDPPCFLSEGDCVWCDHCPGCNFWVPDKFDATISGVTNDFCDQSPDCTEVIDGTHTISMAMSCAWQISPQLDCGSGEITVAYGVNAVGELEISLAVNFGWGTGIDSDHVTWTEVVESGRYNDRTLITSGMSVGNKNEISLGGCTDYPASTTLKGIAPAFDWCLLQCIHTRAIVPSMMPAIPSFSATPGVNTVCTFGCGGGGGAGGGHFGIPGTSSQNAGCGNSGPCPSWDINLENGNVSVHLPMPSAGPGVMIETITLNSSTCVAAVASFFRQLVAENDTWSVTKTTCDGSRICFNNRNPSTGVYRNPMDRTNSILTKNGNGTWTEYDRGTGDTLSYDTSGRFVKLQNAAGQRWTISQGLSGPDYVVDPYNRRMTFSAGRITDVHARITTFTSTASNYKQITPELCETEVKFDASGRIQSFKNASSHVTTFAYDTRSMVSSVTRPDGEQYVFTYNNPIKTTVTDPDGGSTIVKHDLMREVIAISGPTGGTQSFSYDSRDWLKVSENAVGVRTSNIFDENKLKATVSAHGRATFIYDSSELLKAKEDALGNRTTYIRDGSDRLVAVENALGERTTTVYGTDNLLTATINPLGNRTTNVYDSNGQQIASINPLGFRTSFTYEDGQRVTAESPVGAVSTSRYDLNNRLLAQIDPLGNRTSFIYDACTAPVATVQPNGARTSNILSYGILQATIDPLGNRTSFAYNDNNWRIRTENPLGHISTTVYNGDGRPVATISPAGLRSSTVYDAAGRSVAAISPAGVRTSTIYDDCCNRPQATIAANGNRTSFTYDAVGNQIRTKQPTGAINTTVYDAVNRTVVSIDSFAKRSTTIYDAAGQTVASINALNQRSTTTYNAAGQSVASINPLGNRTTQIYDDAGRGIASMDALSNRWSTVYSIGSQSIASVDPLGRRSSSVYNVNGNVVASIDADNNRSTTVYDLAGRTIASVDALGGRTTSIYNAAGQSVASENALGNRSTSVYDSFGRNVSSIAANGSRSTTVYDSKGRAAAQTNPLGNRWSTVFDSVSRPAASVDPLGNRSTTVYDSFGRVVAAENPLGNRTTSVYNSASQVLATIDGNGHRTSSVYDALARQITTVNALGDRTTTSYNADGRTSSLIDARGNRHSFTYNATGAQTQQIDPLNRRTTYGYDSAGQQTLRIDARSNRTTYAFSNVGQLTQRRYPDGSRATFSYSATGNRTLMADSTGRYTAAYDAVGRTTVTASPNNQRATFSYDEIGQRSVMNVSSSGRFTYAYDAAGQITLLLNPFSERTSFSYDNASRRTVQRNANGTRVSLAYDAVGQDTQVFHRTSGGTSILQLDYLYDNAGNRTVMIEDAGSARTTWSYDDSNQLTGEYRTGTNAERQTFTYDAAGNRTLKNIDGTRTTYSYDSANQLDYGQVIVGRTTYTYDQDGNQAVEQPPTGNRTTTTWNFENQPTQYLLPTAGPVTMAYNGDNRRVLKQQDADTTKFVWDSVTDAYVSELDDSDVVIATFTNEPMNFGSIISQRRGSTTRILHADALGTTRAVTDSAETTTDTYLFDAWGNPIVSAGSISLSFRWVGMLGYYLDPSTGLAYVRARVYQAAAARWSSSDPAQPLELLADYVYGDNSPILKSDPSGEVAVENVFEENLGVSPCVRPSLSAWSFVSSSPNGWPCDGRLIQLVNVDCQSSLCAASRTAPRELLSYVEGWSVTKGQPSTDEQFPLKNGGTYTDAAGFTPQDGRWGTYVQHGSIRLFCYKQNSDRTSNAVYVDKKTLDSFLRRRVELGNRLCLTSSIELRGRQFHNPPPWWDLRRMTTEPLAYRAFSVDWTCCADCPIEYRMQEANAEPR